MTPAHNAREGMAFRGILSKDHVSFRAVTMSSSSSSRRTDPPAIAPASLVSSLRHGRSVD